ncbi:hypothetical protein psal_cds_715 [Pandoravirus salinus]|uniref:Uncharacterized protein n=1 Tax=Pandoravirus salinus TaxID=1349410 RepID=S4VYX1_9VIRU|nr:hypothetical protein psal_cds_715 [Pandoravirus salinus]AGO84681.1 hypothetical protein psal_cds_715 [Pandoravirus salinus]
MKIYRLVCSRVLVVSKHYSRDGSGRGAFAAAASAVASRLAGSTAHFFFSSVAWPLHPMPGNDMPCV